MKITVFHGSPRKGNTYAATQNFKKEMEKSGNIEFTEFFLPQALPEFCRGCFLCFEKSEQSCPHTEYTMPILDAMLKADALIFTTPVYVLQTTGAVKAFLDHFGFIFIVHRARPEMFGKKAFVISTTAGAGTKAAMKTIVTNLKFWGVNRIHSLGIAMLAGNFETMNPKRRSKFEKKLKKSAERFYKEIISGKKRSPYLLTKFMFYFSRSMLKKETEADTADSRYWKEQGWFEKSPF
ncbi:MAG: flavodoxin family protein [Oscillospiraceae bacterium]|nr:flavodoxin family protein [Oscillospiraceae bacterium]